MANEEFIIRDAVERDAAAIAEILNHYVRSSTTTFITEPLSVSERREWLMDRRAFHPVIVAELGGVVVGWASLGTFRSRAAYDRTTEISIYIDQKFHRRGLGRRFLEELLKRARKLGHHVVMGVCCAESTASIKLLENAGFERVGQFREVGRKFNRWLDIVCLQMIL